MGEDCSTSEGNNLQNLCDEIKNIGDVLACYAVDTRGRVKGQNFGAMVVDDDFKSRFGEITGVVWGGLKRVEDIAGPITMVTAAYANFKIVGIPIQGTNDCILAVVEGKIDAYAMRERILNYVGYWREKGKGSK